VVCQGRRGAFSFYGSLPCGVEVGGGEGARAERNGRGGPEGGFFLGAGRMVGAGRGGEGSAAGGPPRVRPEGGFAGLAGRWGGRRETGGRGWGGSEWTVLYGRFVGGEGGGDG